MNPVRRMVIGCSMLFCGAWFGHATVAAQAYPSQPISMIVPFAPGGGTDMVARTLAKKLAEHLGQPVVVENRAGGGGAVGAEALVRAKPDGYTLIFGAASYAANAALHRLPYDPIEDITPIALVGETGYVLVLNPGTGITSMEALIKEAKANPGKLNYGSSGVGGLSHLGMVLFDMMAGTEMMHVPYKGTAPAMTDLLGGQIQLMLGSMPPMMPYAKQGQLNAVGVTTSERAGSLPQVPAIGEVLPGYKVALWYGVWGPRGLPTEVVERVNRAIGEIIQQPDVQKVMANDGLEPLGGPPEQFRTVLEQDIAKWKKVVQASGVQAGQ